jgi:putative resolvase
MNLNRRDLRQIIDEAINKKINEVIIVHKDRLCKYGYELVEYIIKKYSNSEITILEKSKNKEELVDDVLQIMNIFEAKINDYLPPLKMECTKWAHN